MSSSPNRIVKNTFFLYGKMLITIFFTLYTTRLVLKSLGVVDYGVFGVIGGAVNMLGFLSASMAATTQRFMSYSEGTGNLEDKRQVFNVSVILHFIIAICACLLLCSFSYLFFDKIINVPVERLYAAKVVYYSMVFSVTVTVLSVPYDAVINSHENMLYYSIVGIIDSFVKLIIAIYIATSVSGDKLIVYGILMAVLSIVVMIVMQIYCHKYYSECVFKPLTYFSKKKLKQMSSFASWKLSTQFTSMVGNYGAGLLMNHYFGAVINAAISIASQVISQLQSFSNNMIKAVNPAIVKSEGENNRESMLQVSMYSCKYSFLIFAIFAAPALVCLDKLLVWWLVDVPQWAYLMTLVGILRSLNECLLLPLETSIGATGKIRGNSFYSSLINIFPLLLLVILFYMGYSPMAYIVVSFSVWGIIYELKTVYFAKKVCRLNIKIFFNEYIKKPYITFLFSVAWGLLVRFLLGDNILSICTTIICVLGVFISLVYFYVMGMTEKKYAKNVVKNICYKINGEYK